MSEFLVYLQIGIKHVLDWNGYDHILFLTVLSCTCTFKDWKKVLILVSIFTVGHTLSLLLSVFDVVVVKAYLIELLIPITIFLTAAKNVFSNRNTKKTDGFDLVSVFTLLFGIVHGLGFSNYFKNLLSGTFTDKLLPTLSFAAGIEVAQVVVVVAVLTVAFACQNIFKVSKRDFVLVISSIVIGVVLPMIIERI